jgi:hypothetical protein
MRDEGEGMGLEMGKEANRGRRGNHGSIVKQTRV